MVGKPYRDISFLFNFILGLTSEYLARQLTAFIKTKSALFQVSKKAY